jgi:hypothetical protein
MDLQNIECQLAQAQMSRYLSGEHLPEDTVLQIEKHVSGCTNCQQVAADKKISLEAMLEDAQAADPGVPELELAPAKADVAAEPEPEPAREVAPPADPALIAERIEQVVQKDDDPFTRELEALAAKMNEEKAAAEAVEPAADPNPTSLLDEPSVLEEPGAPDPLAITDDALAAALNQLEQGGPAVAEPEPEAAPAMVAVENARAVAPDADEDEEDSPKSVKAKKPKKKRKSRRKLPAIDLAAIRSKIRMPIIPRAAVGRGGRGNLRAVGLSVALGAVLLAMSGMMKAGPQAVLGKKVTTPVAPEPKEGSTHDSKPDTKAHDAAHESKDKPSGSTSGHEPETDEHKSEKPAKSEPAPAPPKSSNGLPPQPDLGGNSGHVSAAPSKPLAPKPEPKPEAKAEVKSAPVYEVATSDGGVTQKTPEGKAIAPVKKTTSKPSVSAPRPAKVQKPRREVRKPRRKWQSRPSYSSKQRAKRSQPAAAPKNFVKVYD